jgi:urocanate hydratase
LSRYHASETIQHSKPKTCLGWEQEGIYQLLLNSLAPDVAEDPYEFIVYGNGRAVRDKEALDEFMKVLPKLRNDETLVVQSGKPVGVFATSEYAPRVIMSNAMIVPKWANWTTFHELNEKNLTLYGQSTASSWAYIGAQGILQGTFETLWHVAKAHFGGSLKGRLVLTSGLGGMGCAQPIAVEMNEGVAIVVEADRQKVMKRIETNHIQMATDSIDEALNLAREAMEGGYPLSIGLVGNAAEVYEALAGKGIVPDVVTDQTSAHDLLEGYIPCGMTLGEALQLRVDHPKKYLQAARKTLVQHVQAMMAFKKQGAVVFEYGNHIRGQAAESGFEQALEIPSFIQLFVRDLFCVGTGPIRWIALSGDPEDIFRIDDFLLEAFAEDEKLTSWIRFVQERVHFQGLPARSVWLTYEQRAHLVDKLIELVKTGELKAPIAVTRDHFSGATMASPHRETENMRDGSDAIADWPILNALLMASSGATLVSVQQGGGVGVGYSIHTGMTVIVDGKSDKKVKQTLLGETQFGVLRYADAGYPSAKQMVSTFGVDVGGGASD